MSEEFSRALRRPQVQNLHLSQRLRSLEEAGIVERRRSAASRGFEYHLTEAGRELEPLIMLMGEWGARWVRSRLDPEDLDVALLMWDMHRTVRPECFPARRVVVGFEFTDVPQGKRHWWLVSEGDQADLCVTDPGFEIDLLLLADLRTMTAIWTGDLSVRSALASGALEAHGPAELRRCLEAWLGLSAFAPIESRRAAPALA
jgi:hypothetical protein